MTLCKFRPERKYDAQFIFEQNDVRGLMKSLRVAAGDAARDGLASTRYYEGALMAFETMFSYAGFNGSVDKWTDFMPLFDAAIRELDGEE